MPDDVAPTRGDEPSPRDEPLTRDGEPATREVAGAGSGHPQADDHVIRESITVGLYITISLLAVLTVQPHGGSSDRGVLAVIWGTTLGLLLAHWLAFRLTARLYSGESLTAHDRITLSGQLLAAFAVAGIATVPVLLPGTNGHALSRLTLAGIVGVFAFGVARRHGAGHGRSLLYALIMVGIASAVAIGKYLLTGH